MIKTFGALTLVLIAGAVYYFLQPEYIDATHPWFGPAVQAVYATGTVEATVMLPIAARTTSRLMELNKDEGDSVSQGQILATLEDEDLRQSHNELLARAAFAKQSYKRSKDMFKKQLVSREEYENAKSAWEALEASVRASKARLDYLKLIAPVDGRIIRRDGEIGQLISAGEAIVWIANAPLRISTEVDEEDIALVKVDQKVVVRADAFPHKIFNGRVQSITAKGDPIARSYRVRIALENDSPLLIGMTAETNIIVSENKRALLVSKSAVMQGEQDTVWCIKNGFLTRAVVQVGAKGSDEIEILSGLAADDLVVLYPDSTFEEGQRAHVRLVDFSN